MNWMSLISLINIIPSLIVGIQQIHKDAGTPGVTKKQLALESLGLAGGVAGATLTGQNAAYANVATQLAGNLIDQFTAAFKATSSFGFTPSNTATVAAGAPVTGAAVPGK